MCASDFFCRRQNGQGLPKLSAPGLFRRTHHREPFAGSSHYRPAAGGGRRETGLRDRRRNGRDGPGQPERRRAILSISGIGSLSGGRVISRNARRHGVECRFSGRRLEAYLGEPSHGARAGAARTQGPRYFAIARYTAGDCASAAKPAARIAGATFPYRACGASGARSDYAPIRTLSAVTSVLGHSRPSWSRPRLVLVRCYSNSGQIRARSDCPLSAKSRHDRMAAYLLKAHIGCFSSPSRLRHKMPNLPCQVPRARSDAPAARRCQPAPPGRLLPPANENWLAHGRALRRAQDPIERN